MSFWPMLPSANRRTSVLRRDRLPAYGRFGSRIVLPSASKEPRSDWSWQLFCPIHGLATFAVIQISLEAVLSIIRRMSILLHGRT